MMLICCYTHTHFTFFEDNESESKKLLQVRGLPTLFFISPDPTKDAIRTEGLIPLQMMRDIIDNEM